LSYIWRGFEALFFTRLVKVFHQHGVSLSPVLGCYFTKSGEYSDSIEFTTFGEDEMQKLTSRKIVTDHLTGEIVSDRSNVFEITKLPQEPEYIKLYIAEIGRMHGLKAGHRDILMYVAANVGYDGYVVLNVRRKGQIAITLGISPRSIDNALSEFVKAGLLTRLGRSDFELNPFLFGKGEWKKIRERQESFVSRLYYGPDGVRSLGIERPQPSDDEKRRIELEANGQQRLTE
jgi:hypothetical protein